METTETQTEETRGRTAGGRSCQKRHLTAVGAAVGLAVIILVNALVVNLVLSATQRPGPEEDETLKTFGEDQLEELHQCRQENRDLNLILQTITQDSRCRLCPTGWLWWRNHCYFFSVGQQENLPWNKSAEFCQQHNSSLVMIKDSAEMDFLQRVMGEFPHFPFLWVGLTDRLEEGQWLWWDGTDVQHYLQSVTVDWDSEDRDCADLRDGGTLFAAECDVYGPWICKKPI